MEPGNRPEKWKSPWWRWRALRGAARDMRTHPTSAEDIFWSCVRGRKFHSLRFRRQHAIGQFIADFYCAEHNLIIEIDGPIHQRSLESDRVRAEFLAATGVRVVRIRNEEILEDLPRVLVTLAETIGVSSPSPRGGEGVRG